MSKKLTTEEFINKSKQVHGDKYDYSLVAYVNNHTKVKIVCSKHGVFEQTPNDHLSGKGCKKCADESNYRGASQRLTTEDFIEKSRVVHANEYDYSKVEYVNNHTKVTIICPEHGEFKQRPSSHLSGKKCGKCAGTFMNTEYFIEKSRVVHENKYDYSKVDYVNQKTKVIIICPKHGEFKQQPTIHYLNGCGCPKCADESNYRGASQRLTTKDFIMKSRAIHGDIYDYSKSIYLNQKTKVTIICPEHGEFKQNPCKHYYGQGCPKCSKITKGVLQRLTTEEFINRAILVHGNKYIYSNVNYITSQTKIIIVCPLHGKWEQVPSSHLDGAGCPFCAGNIDWKNRNLMSFSELKKLVRSKNIKTQKQYNEWYKKNKEWCQINGIPASPQNVYK